jgi:putative peptide zinc metalloprotease protein
MERPTFSEHWNRVAGLTPRLRASVEVTPQRFRGERWHVLRDPATNAFFRLSPSAYHLAGLLDGRRSVERAWRIASELDGNDAPTQPEAIQLLAQLHANNLLRADLPGDTVALFERTARRRSRERLGRAASFLFLRIPLLDPDRLLDRLTPALGWAFSIPALVLWFTLLALAGGAMATGGARLADAAGALLRPENLPFTYAAFLMSKLLHELAHGVATKRFAAREGTRAEVHTLGVMLLVFIPYPFVDASAAWSLRSKWRRAAIGAAGMYAELALAAVAALVWANTAPGPVNTLAINIVMIASVATLLFNANPLLRYDGYYILSDLTETPNLSQRATERLRHLVKRHAWGVRSSHAPTRSGAEAALLAFYAVASGIYRLAIGVAIILVVSRFFFVIGAVLAIAAAAVFFLVPVVRLVGYLLTSPELDHHRARAIGTTLAALGLALGLAGLAPAPRWVTLEGVVEPARRADVYALEPGVVEALPDDPVEVRAGDRIALSSNPELATELAIARARLRAAERSLNAALATDPSLARIREQELAARSAQLADLERRHAGLELAAAFDGTFIPAGDGPPIGRAVDKGVRLGSLIDTGDLRVRAPAGQAAASGLIATPPATVEIRPVADPSRVLSAPAPAPRPAPARRGGAGAVSAPAERAFELVVPIDDATGLRPGQRVRLRASLPPEPVLWRARRSLIRLLQDEGL